MSFFFDVWSREGFILASDVTLIDNMQKKTLHKLAAAPRGSKVVCAIAVCGDYPENCIKFFIEAAMIKDSLRDLALAFGEKWTKRYSGTRDYSGVHLVGFERMPDCGMVLPQMWFWCNWQGPNPDDFYPEEVLSSALTSFSELIPQNNHIPYKIKELTGKFPEPTLMSEAELVNAFLKVHQPFFTWNGDTAFWRSALGAVNSAMNLLAKDKTNWSIDEVGRLTRYCLTFLAKTGSLLESSSVALSADDEADILKVTPSGIERISWAKLSAEDQG
jgi:hypothetical protein